MRRCARCDWRIHDGDRDTQIAELKQHAELAEHPLCLVCKGRSLRSMERLTCAACVASVRADLADIENFYSRLPGVLVEKRFPGNSAAERTGGTPEPPLPGGDALTMLAGGGKGGASMVFAPGTSWHENIDHHHDERRNDPPSVAALLAIHEDDWRDLLKHPAAGPANVSTSIAYLLEQLDGIAQSYSEFDSFADDVRMLLTQLRAVVGMGDQPVSGAPCFDCGAPLVRRYSKDGLEDEWSCSRCDRRYEHAEYFLALRAELERQREIDALTRTVCKVPGCGESTFDPRSGWCAAHWARWRTTSDPVAEKDGGMAS